MPAELSKPLLEPQPPPVSRQRGSTPIVLQKTPDLLRPLQWGPTPPGSPISSPRSSESQPMELNASPEERHYYAWERQPSTVEAETILSPVHTNAPELMAAAEVEVQVTLRSCMPIGLTFGTGCAVIGLAGKARPPPQQSRSLRSCKNKNGPRPIALPCPDIHSFICYSPLTSWCPLPLPRCHTTATLYILTTRGSPSTDNGQTQNDNLAVFPSMIMYKNYTVKVEWIGQKSVEDCNNK